MDIYFVDISENYELEKQKNSKLQHRVGREVLAYLLKNKYDVESEVLEDNGKPYVDGNSVYFSISHSDKLVGLAFSKSKIGLDIEKKKKRNYREILKHFKIEDESITEDNFFQMWTVYEAEYKSCVKENLISFEYENYMVSVSFEGDENFNFYKLNFKDKNLSELKKPNYLENLPVKI